MGRYANESERLSAQWKAAAGCPVSDEAKTRFAFQCPGSEHRFVLADIRIWKEGSTSKSADELALEFFFDGAHSDIPDEKEFILAFERMIENQLKERRMQTFRNKLQARAEARCLFVSLSP